MGIFGDDVRFVEPQADPMAEPHKRRKRLPYRWIVVGGLGVLLIICCSIVGISGNIAKAMQGSTPTPAASPEMALTAVGETTMPLVKTIGTPEATATLIDIYGLMTQYASSATSTEMQTSTIMPTGFTPSATTIPTETRIPSNTPRPGSVVVRVITQPFYSTVVVSATPQPTYTPYPTYTRQPTAGAVQQTVVVTRVVIVTATFTATPIATATTAPTNTPLPTDTTAPTDTPAPTLTTPTETETPTETPTNTETPTETPTP